HDSAAAPRPRPARGAARMSDQASSGSVTGLPEDGSPHSLATPGWVAPETFHGRTVSWVAVSIIMIGFVIGGLGLVLCPAWWLFWVGVGLSGIGGLLRLATNIFEDWY